MLHLTNLCSILKDIFLHKSKPILVGVLHRPSDKPEFIEYLNNLVKENNTSNTQECYLIGDFNVNLLSGNPYTVKKYLDLCFSHSIHKLIMEPTRTYQNTLRPHLTKLSFDQTL